MGIKLIKISVVYFVIGVLLGLYMSMTGQYIYTSVHAHINLLGWTSMTLAGILYLIFPRAGMSPLGKVHFWMHNIALPVMMLGLFLVLAGHLQWLPLVSIGAIGVVIAVIVFAINIFLNVNIEE
ncbi:cbb3-type cytochrome oxidase subunit 1 [Alkalibacillus filiformis]|uniref:Cbb3-type cytochrome oxidase subunit 1 n=1 Tax=Alkalibacillus filiformis TaxID=200990 RepID=A0ABU0DPR1_9BACI|nr:cytochrome-c oxidase [Alkalibacillus filiformis]MDQ0350278.1 cbb3-type cytochrome oxidase subunit 1 [Alkalibacillus filiformis]